MEATGEMKKSSSLVASHNYANPTPLQENDLEKKMNAIYGRKCLERFGKFSRHGLWAKMFSELLIGMEGWYSTKCKLTWKLKGTKYNRMYFQLQPSTLPTEETGFGLLPTVKLTDSHPQRELTNGENVSKTTGVKYGLHLTQMAQARMLPTPTAFDWNSARTEQKWEEDKKKWIEKGVNLQMPLKQMARFQMLPTPRASGEESYETRSKRQEHKKAMSYLDANIQHKTGENSQLNPLFVEEMMGFPENWTLLPFLNGEMKA